MNDLRDHPNARTPLCAATILGVLLCLGVGGPATATIRPLGSDDFEQHVRDVLAEMRVASPAASGIISALEASPYVVTIIECKIPQGSYCRPLDGVNAGNGVGTGSWVAWERYSSNRYDNDVFRNPDAALLHELVHAQRNAAGTRRSGVVVVPGSGTIPRGEIPAITVENAYRQECGKFPPLRSRTRYGDVPLPLTPPSSAEIGALQQALRARFAAAGLPAPAFTPATDPPTKVQYDELRTALADAGLLAFYFARTDDAPLGTLARLLQEAVAQSGFEIAPVPADPIPGGTSINIAGELHDTIRKIGFRVFAQNVPLNAGATYGQQLFFQWDLDPATAWNATLAASPALTSVADGLLLSSLYNAGDPLGYRGLIRRHAFGFDLALPPAPTMIEGLKIRTRASAAQSLVNDTENGQGVWYQIFARAGAFDQNVAGDAYGVATNELLGTGQFASPLSQYTNDDRVMSGPGLANLGHNTTVKQNTYLVYVVANDLTVPPAPTADDTSGKLLGLVDQPPEYSQVLSVHGRLDFVPF